jgi:hypothetical protein
MEVEVKVEVEAGGGWWERTWMADGCEVLFGRARCCLLEEFRRDVGEFHREAEFCGVVGWKAALRYEARGVCLLTDKLKFG